eukprot:c4302_g1_i1.p1 GENE.c4302_g1_i1~~c4302_g1_i1.p1  ORF type:complete len:283 (-),score=43.93 c4302_g1_i1:39-845(-)
MQKLTEEFERMSERFYLWQKFVPVIARFFLVATFFEDGFRMFWDWDLQMDYVGGKVGRTFASLFLVLSAIMQIVGGTLVVLNHQTEHAAFLLLSNIVLQALVYGIFSDVGLMLRNLALAGGLLLLVSEKRMNEGRRAILTAPISSPSKSVQYLQFTGRVLLVLLIVAHMPFKLADLTFIDVIMLFFCGVLLVMVVSGFKTRLSALVLVIITGVTNIAWNNFWQLEHSHPERDFFQYYFFQTLSILGGLMLLVAVGPGELSVDAQKKRF